MKTRFSILLLLLTLGFNANAQLAVDDVLLAPDLKLGNKQVTLNGGGLRKKFFLNIYVAGLYLSNGSSDAQEIVKADEAMSIQLHIVSDMITSSQMISSMEDGFKKSTGGTHEKFRTEIDLLTSIFSGQIKQGDYYDITYSPDTGVGVYKNGNLNASFGDLEFKKALWGIWLGDDPVDSKLKKEMLNL